MNELNWQPKDLWRLFNAQESRETSFAKQILHWFNLDKNLPILSYKDQIELLDNCPIDLLEKYARLIKPQAAKKLGLEVPQAKKKEWRFKALF